MIARQTTPAVLCHQVTRLYGSGQAQVRALRGVDLEIPRGQLTMLVGPSGCGKTTLLSIIAAMLDASSGDVDVLGNALSRLSAAEKVALRRERIGFVFQQYHLLPALSAVENAAVPLVIQGWSRRRATARAMELLERMELGDRTAALPAQLSGGQQQRVAIARSLVHEPELIICDEPTSALDAHTGQTIMQLLRRVVDESGRTVLVVTHDARIFSFADRLAEMEDGRIVNSKQP